MMTPRLHGAIDARERARCCGEDSEMSRADKDDAMQYAILCYHDEAAVVR